MALGARLRPEQAGAADNIRALSRGTLIDPPPAAGTTPAHGGPAKGAASALAPAIGGAVRPVPRRARWWVELLVIGWLCWLYDAITNLAPLRMHAALGNAWAVLHLEQTLHLDPERSLNRWLAARHTLGLVLSDYYDNAHFLVTLALLAWLWWRRADLYRPLRNSLVLVNVLGFIVFWLYPVAPPRMLSSYGFTDVAAARHAFGDWHAGALASHANQLAAMPSLHIAWAAWCTLALWQISRRRWVRVLAVLYPCLTAFAVLATGNHFLFDVLAGLLALALAVLAVVAPARIAARWRALARAAAGRRPSLVRGPLRPAYRMSQTCYEVLKTLE
jgi:hypothetical protein